MSFHGSNEIPTPNIDALAFGGVILNSHYAQPICSPTRGALMTGYQPIHTGCNRQPNTRLISFPVKPFLGNQGNVLWYHEPHGVPLRFRFLPEYLRNLGYATHMVGKWHMGYHRSDNINAY